MTASYVLQVGDTVICAGIAPMAVPSGGAHARYMEIHLPFTFTETPAVTATPRAVSGPASTGTVLGIWSVIVNINPNDTQIVIHAANVSELGAAIDGDFVCDYTVVGTVK